MKDRFNLLGTINYIYKERKLDMIFNTKGRSVDVSTESRNNIVKAILKESLTRCELKSYLRNKTHINIALTEGVVTEETVNELGDEIVNIPEEKEPEVNDAGEVIPVPDTTEVENTAVLAIAKENIDEDLAKYITVLQMKKELENRLTEKNGAEGKSRIADALQAMGVSESHYITLAAKRYIAAKKAK